MFPDVVKMLECKVWIDSFNALRCFGCRNYSFCEEFSTVKFKNEFPMVIIGDAT